jgi:putative endonuclease
VAEFPPKAGKGRLGRLWRPRWTQMEYVYVLRSKKDKKFYIGLTNNLNRRLQQHNSGEVSSTKGRRPLELIFFESYIDRKEAAKRENFLNQEKAETN